MNTENVFIIGGAGLIGSYIVEGLLEIPNINIVVFDNFSRGKLSNLPNNDRIKIINGDILHKDFLIESMKNSSAVIHLAALWLNHCQEYFDSAFEVNIRGTKNVLDACIANNIKKLVFSSSASVYGNALYEIMEEDHPYNNETMYGTTKIAGEHLVKSYYHKYGLNSIILRYFNVYGPRQDYQGAYISVIMRMIDNILQNKSPVVFGDGSQSFDFIYVNDVAKSNILALFSDIEFDIFNVCTQKTTSIKTIAEILLKLMNSNVTIEYKSGSFPVSSRLGGLTKIKNLLGFKPTIPLETGLKMLLDWRLSNDR